MDKLLLAEPDVFSLVAKHLDHAAMQSLYSTSVEIRDCIKGQAQFLYEKGLINNTTTGISIGFKPLPDFALEIINDGGLLNHISKK